MDRHRVMKALDACKISDAALLKATGIERARLALVLVDKATVSLAEAQRLARYFGTDAQWWMTQNTSKN